MKITCKKCNKTSNIIKLGNSYFYDCECEPDILMKHVRIPDYIPKKQHKKYLKKKYEK